MATRPRHPLLWVLGTAVTAVTVGAHVRLQYPANGNVLFWSTPSNVSIVIQSDGSADINDGSEHTAIRNAIAAWNGVGSTTLNLVENQSSGQQSRRDWASTDLHTVLFDEDNDTGYFPGSSGIVAITPITFFTNGQIIDADVLFNGKSFAFTTEGALGRFDVQDVATHELGHLIGLDHSGCAGATMYPYVDASVILHRSLSLDDIRGAQHAYPSGAFGQVMGTVVRAGSSSVVRGAHVVARDVNGRFAGATLTNDNGSFTLRSLSAGSYSVYADALDFPVGGANLGGGQTIDTDFESTILSASVAVTAGSTASIGTVSVDPNVTVSLGRVADDYPLRVITGQTVSRLVRGIGLVSGSSLTASDPALTVTPTAWFGSSVQFDVTVPPGAALGHVDLVVTTLTGDTDILTAALELTPPNPTVTLVDPGVGDDAGGDLVTLTGTGFRANARVVIGNRIYADGASGGCTVVDANTITLVTASTMGGTHDVVVIDESGVEGRATGAFAVAAPPSIATMFPTVGSTDGGTELILTGTNFVAGALVEIDGVVQPNVTLDSPTQLTVVTAPGMPGGPYVVEVTNPGGLVASTAFTYVANDDPVVTNVSPDHGSPSGGEMITVQGSGFSLSSTVVFGAHAKSGAGGVAAASVQFVDATTLLVQTPASSSTSETVLVRDVTTGQASILSGAFEFEQSPEIPDFGGFGGFGGCGSIDPRDCGPATPRSVLSGAGWVLAAFAAALLQRRAARARTLASAGYPGAV